MVARVGYGLRAWAVGMITLGGFGGCGLSTEGLPGADPPIPCDRPEDCDDNNLCTVNNCSPDKICVFPATTGADPPNQIPGDCKRVTCTSGKQIAADDNDDSDDANPCTADSCKAGMPGHDAPAMEGKQCLLGSLQGTCESGGCIVKCGPDNMKCDDSNPCTDDACNVDLGQCEFAPLHGKLVDDLSMTDCVETRCVQDKATTVPDDTEVPDDGKECTTDSCKSNSPLHQPLAAGTACGSSGEQKCSPDGVCVGCNQDSDCVGTSDFCKTIACSNQSCATSYTPTGTPLPDGDQLGKDCKQSQCADMGAVMIVDYDPDVPDDDGNECTDPACSGGTPYYAPRQDGSGCSQGVCLSGVCVPCIADGDCPNPGDKCGALAPNTCCSPATCGSLGATCGSLPDGCGGTALCDTLAQDGDETDVDCGGTTCATQCGQGQGCAAATDCASAHCSDGYCCDAACTNACRACSAVLTGQANGTCAFLPFGSEDDVPYCGGTNACNGGGACKKHDGQPCTLDSGCLSVHCSPEISMKVCCDTACTGQCESCLFSRTGVADGTCAPITADTDPDNDCTTGTQCCQGVGMCGGSGC